MFSLKYPVIGTVHPHIQQENLHAWPGVYAGTQAARSPPEGGKHVWVIAKVRHADEDLDKVGSGQSAR